MDDRAPQIVAFAGSLRRESFNRRLLKYAIDGARTAGGEVEELGPDHLTLPLYNADLEHDGRYPETVTAWRDLIARCDGLLIAAPEYNHGMPGVLKNAIDWASRPPSVFSGKVAASFGTSPGAFGTARSQTGLRTVLMALNIWVVPRTVLIPHARDAFDVAGNLQNERQARDLAALGAAVVHAVRAGIGKI